MTIGHNSHAAFVGALPASVQDIADTLGLDVVFALVEHFGGVELRIPHKLKPDHKLMVLGEERAQALCQFCPEDTILVPMTLDKKHLSRKVRDLEAKKWKRWEIARELQISQRHVRRLANAAPKDDEDQFDLFKDLDND